jgi:hypothetical protein
MTLRSIKLLREMSTANLPKRKLQPAINADKTTAICELTVYTMWEHRRLTTLQVTKTCL